MNQQLLDACRRWVQAERADDAHALAPLLHEDFAAVGPLGFVLDRNQWLARYDGGLHNQSFDWEEVSERDFGTCALVIGTQTQTSSYQDRPSNGEFRVTQVWLNGGGDGWRLASIHLSPIVQPSDTTAGPPRSSS